MWDECPKSHSWDTNLIKLPDWKFSISMLDSILSKLFIRGSMWEKISKIKKNVQLSKSNL